LVYFFFRTAAIELPRETGRSADLVAILGDQ